MHYHFYIHPSTDLCQKEPWERLININKLLRFKADSRIQLTDPLTGKKITLGEPSLDVEFYDETSETWLDAFAWEGNRIVVQAHFEPGDELSKIWKLVSWVAQKLDASITGQRGEQYDNYTGYILNNGKGLTYDFEQKNTKLTTSEQAA